jgi:IclR family transcriptional regulator, KDG regulon repressor
MIENISGTVNKAIDVLEIFLQKDGDLSLTELSEMTGFNKATVYRLVSTLVKRRFLYQVRKNGRYSLGLKMIDCSAAIRRNLKFIDLSYLYLGKINAAHNTAVNLTILDVDKSLMVEEVGISSQGIPASTMISKRLPLHCTACGKVLLAFMPEKDRRLLYSRNSLKAFTRNTIIDVFQLERELEQIRKDGVAYDKEDYKPGLWAIAVPVYSAKNEIIAAASIIVPPSRTDSESIKYLTGVIKTCGKELSQAISRTG